jgi:hypothetical protein
MSLQQTLQNLSAAANMHREQACNMYMETEFKNMKKLLVSEANRGFTNVTSHATALGLCQCTTREVQKFYAEKGLQVTVEKTPTVPNLPPGVLICTNNAQTCFKNNTQNKNPDALLAPYDNVSISWN